MLDVHACVRQTKVIFGDSLSPYWFKVGLSLKFLGNISMPDAKDNFMRGEIRPIQGQIGQPKTLNIKE